MFRSLAAGVVLAVVASAAGAEEKAPAWVRESNGVDLRFVIGKDTGTFWVVAGDNGVTLKAKITRDKDVVKAEFTEVTVKGEFPNAPKKGEKISFKWVEKGDTATLSDFKGDGGADDAKGVVEGEYKKRK